MSATFSKIWWYICSIVRKFNHGGGIPFNRPISHRTILGGAPNKNWTGLKSWECLALHCLPASMAHRKNLLSKHCHATNPTSLSTFSLDFSHHKIQDGAAWYGSTCTCLTKTLKVGELLVHDILWGETEIETGTETERWSDSMTILISLTELTFLSKISTGNFSGKPVEGHVFHWCDEWLVSRQELTRDWRVWLTTMRVGKNTQFTVH